MLSRLRIELEREELDALQEAAEDEVRGAATFLTRWQRNQAVIGDYRKRNAATRLI